MYEKSKLLYNLNKKRVKMKIVISVVVAVLLIGCSEDNSVVEKETKQLEKKSETVIEIKTKEKSIIASKEVVKEVKKTALVTEKTVKPKEEKKETAVKKVLKKETVAVSSNGVGAEVFKKCSACHGKSGESKALNKSAIIKGWQTQRVITAINGYKDGTYGSAMKGVMKPQVAKLSEAEIKAVSEYISGL